MTSHKYIKTKVARKGLCEMQGQLIQDFIQSNNDVLEGLADQDVHRWVSDIWIAILTIRMAQQSDILKQGDCFEYSQRALSFGSWKALLDLLNFCFGADAFSALHVHSLRPNMKSVESLFNGILPSGSNKFPSETLGLCYEYWLEYDIKRVSGSLELTRSSERSLSGSYYTPPELCNFLVQEMLQDLVSSASKETILDLRICDPAMGAGAFLLSAFRHLRDIILLENGSRRDLIRLASNCLYGVDLNPDVVSIGAIALWLELGDCSSFTALSKNFKSGNALFGFVPKDVLKHDEVMSESLETENRRLQSVLYGIEAGYSAKALKKCLISKVPTNLGPLKERPFHWTLMFPEVFTEEGGFSMVIGNPPYLSAMTGGVDKVFKSFLRFRYPELSGRADLSAYFWRLALDLCHPKGRIGFVLPRALLGSGAIRALRSPSSNMFPRLIYSPNHYRFFDDAKIKIMCLILGPSGPCRLSDADSPFHSKWQTCSDFTSEWEYIKDNWWAHFWVAVQKKSWPKIPNFRLGDLGFEVRAGIGPNDFYKLVLKDEKGGTDPKLIVSGLIDPNRCDWGKKSARYKGVSVMYPRVQPSPNDSNSLSIQLRESKRPKLILANLVSKLECFVDEKGECIGATATYCIFDRQNDVQRLKWLSAIFHREKSYVLFHLSLGANAMHSNLSIRSDFLRAFPIPKPPRAAKS